MLRSARLHGPSNDRDADRAAAHTRECFEIETTGNRRRDPPPVTTPWLQEWIGRRSRARICATPTIRLQSADPGRACRNDRIRSSILRAPSPKEWT
ncbi:hypothetical protein Q3A80_03110 [Burkholderia sp. SR8]|uniref:hypothetical protein n=1 Tax=Burkholderia sp. SR8 TaxID=3062277 RepID=UPI0040638162